MKFVTSNPTDQTLATTHREDADLGTALGSRLPIAPIEDRRDERQREHDPCVVDEDVARLVAELDGVLGNLETHPRRRGTGTARSPLEEVHFVDVDRLAAPEDQEHDRETDPDLSGCRPR